MPWPLSQDYNEAIQNPAQCFFDPELKQGEAVTNALGLPIPCSGNFADVYAVQCGQRKWAVKCFTRQIPGLKERYAEVSKYLQQLQLPFMVEFQFLDQGIHVAGQWYPILKMQWVEGFPLNTFVRDNLDKPQVLRTLCQIWQRLAIWLREANLAHCDLQHGNVLLVPGAKATTLGVKLVDYDGMCVPALELLKSMEVGHPCYQHPQRLREGTYGLHIDRFSILVIYTALRALVVGGRALWEKFDNGDNLLFTQKDFEAPRQAAILQELIKLNDPEVRKLAQAVAIASQKPIDQVPLLDQLVSAPKPQTGVAPRASLPAQTQRGSQSQQNQPAPLEAVSPFAAATADDTSQRGRTRYRAKRKRGPVIAVAVCVAVLALIGGVAALVIALGSGPRSTEAHVAQGASLPDRTTRTTQTTLASRPTTRPRTQLLSTTPEPKPADPEPKTEPRPGPETEADQIAYLSDMRETEAKTVNGHPFANGGRLGFSGGGGGLTNNETRVLVGGIHYKKGLSTHGIGNQEAFVAYDLEGRYKNLVGAAAVNDTAHHNGGTVSPLTFKILGDGRELWRSSALQKAGSSQKFEVDVTGVKRLDLKVFCTDPNSAHAVWLDPYVAATQSPDGNPSAPVTAEVGSFNGHTGKVTGIVFTKDGQSVISGSEDKTVRLWNLQTRKEAAQYPGVIAPVHCLAISPNGSRLCGIGAHDMNLWDTETRNGIIRPHTADTDSAWKSVAFATQDGRTWLTGCSSGHIKKLTNASTQLQAGDAAVAPVSVLCIACTKDGKLAAAGGPDGVVRLYDLEKSSELKQFSGHVGDVLAVALTPDGQTLVSAGVDKTIRVWNPSTGRITKLIKGHTGPATSLALSPEGDRIISGSEDRTVRLWDPKTGREIRVFKGHTDVVACVAVSPDGKTAASGSADKTLRLWELDEAVVAPGDPKKIYKIRNLHSDKYLNVYGGSTEDGGMVVQWSGAGSTNAQWKIEPTKDGYCKIRNVHSGKCLTVNSASTEDGAKIVQWADDGSKHSLWKIEPVKDGHCKIRNVHSGKYLNVQGASTKDGGNVVQRADDGSKSATWKIELVNE